MAGGLVALLDDVAALARIAAASLDDVAAGTMKAGAKAAGVVIDDAAVTPQYLQGVRPARELPIVKKIAVGSIRNKLLFILPVILLLSQFLPVVLTPILMLGGTYLCYEGAEKVYEKIRGKHAEREEPSVKQGRSVENSIVRSAVATDFVLSAEIMVISLDQVITEAFWIRAAILVAVAILITVAVYGAVALLVKMDDLGLRLAEKPSEISQKIGAGLVNAMPKVMDTVTVIGTVAMLWVGGHILLNGVYEFGFDPIHAFIQSVAEKVDDVAVIGGLLAWLADTVVSLIVGLIWGLVALAIVHPILTRVGKDKEDKTAEARAVPTVSTGPVAAAESGAPSVSTEITELSSATDDTEGADSRASTGDNPRRSDRETE